MADILLELPAFDQLFGPNIENKRAIRTAQHTLDLVDPNVAVCCGFLNRQRHFDGSALAIPRPYCYHLCVTFRTVDLET